VSSNPSGNSNAKNQGGKTMRASSSLSPKNATVFPIATKTKSGEKGKNSSKTDAKTVSVLDPPSFSKLVPQPKKEATKDVLCINNKSRK